jgi:serine/threonine protein kinase
MFRDLKPEDILMNGDGSRTFLAEFGLSTNETYQKTPVTVAQRT